MERSLMWESSDRVQKNDAGQFRALIGGEWVPVEKAQKNDAGQFRVLRSSPQEQSHNPAEGMSNFNKFAAGAGKAIYDIGRGVGQTLGVVSDEDVAESRKIDAALMETGAGKAGHVTGNIAAFIPASLVPGANTLVGSAMVGSAMGAMQPTVEGESRAQNIATGGFFGLGGFGLGKLLGKAANAAHTKVTGIEGKIAAKAAEKAAAETASARGAAGNAAQNAYRQLEHLRELGAIRGLSPEQAQLAAALEKELAEKAMEKLIPAAALKNSTAAAYREAMETEAQRAAAMAADKLSNAEVKRQVMARLARYGPAAAGGVIGNMVFPGMGGAVGGAATGLVLRPAIRSMVNLSKNPAVQRALLAKVAEAPLLTNPYTPRLAALLAAQSSLPSN